MPQQDCPSPGHIRHSTSAAAGRTWPQTLATALVVAAALTACSGGNDSVGDTTSVATSSVATTVVAVTTTVAPTTTVPAPVVITLTPTLASATSYGGDDATPISDQALIDEITNAAVAYVQSATLAPLGGTKSDVAALLTAEAAAALNEVGRDALVDDQMPVIVASPTSTLNLTIAAFTGPDDAASIAVVGLDLVVAGSTIGGAPISVHRTGDLTFAKGDAGWKIDAFSLTVDREMP